ncbi:hypothetical protein HDV00_011755 [Rhizophlyctis rosea]|nr:hypothetical protein HDV00_011755 [Rhizophlyctis rosea]
MSGDSPVAIDKKPVHLVVLMHGLWGNAKAMTFTETNLKKRFGDKIEIMNHTGSEGTRTYDGIDTCGERIADAVIERLSKKDARPVTHLSFIGYSLGGVMVRYAAGLLYAQGIFDEPTTPPSSTPTVIPQNFITIATPNAGAAARPDTAFGRLFNTAASFFTSRSGAQMMLRDHDGDDIDQSNSPDAPKPDQHTYPAHGGCRGKSHTGKPLLETMSDPRYPFWQALARFKYRTAFANTINDRLVNFTTSSLEASNLYKKEGARWEVADPQYPSIVRLVPEPGMKQEDVGKGEGDAVLGQEAEVQAEIVEAATGGLGASILGVGEDKEVVEKVPRGDDESRDINKDTDSKSSSSTGSSTALATPSSTTTTTATTTTSTKTPPASISPTNRYAFFALLPLMLPIGLTILTSFLTATTIRHLWTGTTAPESKKRRAEIIAAAKSKHLPPLPTSTSDESLLKPAALNMPPPDNKPTSHVDELVVMRAGIIRRLNELGWRKVHCRIEHRRSHAAIVARFPGGEDVVMFLAEKVFEG